MYVQCDANFQISNNFKKESKRITDESSKSLKCSIIRHNIHFAKNES